ncbi:MAG: FHA domain-containing protein [Gemmatimonadales bacterium]
MIFVEVLDRRGHVAARVRVEVLPAIVGRSYGSAVILDDRYVSPEHLRIARDETGALVVEDLGSTNGVYDAAGGARLSRITLRPGLQLRIGRTVVRFGFADQPVPPALPDPAVGGLGRALTSPRTVVGVCVAAPVLVGWQAYLGDYGRVSAAEPVSAALVTILLLAIWAGGWAFASRVLVHRPHFPAHLAVASAGVIAGMALGTVTSYVEYLRPSQPGVTVVAGLGWIGLGGAVLYGHLTLASSLTQRRRAVAAALVTIALAGIAELVEQADQDESVDNLEFSGVLKPLGTGWLRTTSLDAFLGEADKLQERADSLAARRPGDGS